MNETTRFLPAKGASAASGSDTLPADLLEQSSQRLGYVCLLYAALFFLANFVSAGVAGQPGELEEFGDWGPGAISIAVALVVFGVSRSRLVRPASLMILGLLFEVAGSFGIAFAELWQVYDTAAVRAQDLDYFGLSWVAPWIVCFTIVVPNRPRRALLAAMASGASVPVTIGLSMAYGGTMLIITPIQFVAGVILPYVLCAGMAYGAARIVYRLGADVRRAREMGSYHLEELLGRGGMGEVWRGRHRMLARTSAVKLIRDDQLGQSAEEGGGTVFKRFEQEARSTAALRSPHTIEVYDFGLSDEGTFYYVMELLDGFDLETLVTRHGPQPAERVVHLLRQACHSLDEAHRAGLVHRDIKPSNLFTCRYGNDLDFLKVLDFGLVTERMADAEGDAKLTGRGTIVGSPAFMAPEMVLDKPVDGRADLYALGCVAYWLLTGSLLFEDESPMSLLVKHARDVPEPPSAVSELRIPEGLERIVMACLEKDPARRPQTARELSYGLAEVRFERDWTEERMRLWWRDSAGVPCD